mgnify:CR=1 FL=1
MNKKYIIIISTLVILGLAVGGYCWYWQSKKAGQPSESSSEVITPSVSTNPLENKPNVNPIDQTNPFKNVKTNPFK